MRIVKERQENYAMTMIDLLARNMNIQARDETSFELNHHQVPSLRQRFGRLNSFMKSEREGQCQTLLNLLHLATRF